MYPDHFITLSGMVKKKNASEKTLFKKKLQGVIGEKIQNELASRAAASSSCHFKVSYTPRLISSHSFEWALDCPTKGKFTLFLDTC